MQEISGLSNKIIKQFTPIISVFHLVVWIFGVVQIPKNQQKRLRNMYGQSDRMIYPVFTDLQSLKKLLKDIKINTKNCIIKVAVDKKLIQVIQKLKDSNTKIFNRISEIYIYNQVQTIEQTYSQIYGKPVSHQILGHNFNSFKSQFLPKDIKTFGNFSDLGQAIDNAEKQVEKLTKSFRTFQNSHCLVDNFDKINLYRYRLISFINMKLSDFNQSKKRFQDFAKMHLKTLNEYLNSIGKQKKKTNLLFEKLSEYYQLAEQFHEKQQRLKKQDNQINRKQFQECRFKFCNEVISIYQQQGLYYQLLNSNMRILGDKSSEWRSLSMPFTHIYNSIKYLYKQNIQQKQPFYLQPFVTYRLGRARKSQLEQYIKHQGKKVFIEFYGVLSTSLSAKFIADMSFKYRQSRDYDGSSFSGDSVDEDVVFRITVSPNLKMYEASNDLYLNGYFKLNKQQKQGSKENQVLFNALNVYRLDKISKKIFTDLFSPSDLQEIKQIQLERQGSKLNQIKYNLQGERLKSYKNQVTVIDLQFGSFYEVIFEKNPYNLSKQAQMGKENYIHCMKKIRKYDKFDEADVYQLTNDLEKSYEYLSKKIGINQEQKFAASILDDKNYIQRMSLICRKLGKVNEACKYSEIAVQCFKHLNSIHLKQVYNSHYDKQFEMQMRCVEIYRENNNFIQAQDKLREQLLEIRSQKMKQMPKAKIKQSEIYIQQAIHYYSVGMLDDCINRFNKSQHNLQKIIKLYTLQIVQPYQYLHFIRNLFCPYENKSRTCSITKYREMVKSCRQEQLVSKYGTLQQLGENEKLSKQMLQIVRQVVQNRAKYFKNPKEYEDMIKELTLLNLCSTIESKQNGERSISSSIKDKILRLISMNEGQQYSKIRQQLEENFKELGKMQLKSLQDDEDQSIKQIIKIFKEKQLHRRKERLKAQKQKIFRENQNLQIEQYYKLKEQLEDKISQLRNDGYSRNNNIILKVKTDIAEINYKANQRQKALKEINQIIQWGQVQGQQRFVQMASAKLIQGKIYFDIFKYEQALDCLDQCIRYFEQSVHKFEWDMIRLQVSSVTINQENNDSRNQRNFKQFRQKQLKNNISYMQAKILRLKGLLIRIQQMNLNGNIVGISSWTEHSKSYKDKNINQLLAEVLTQLSQIKNTINGSDNIKDLGDLKCNILEVQYQYSLNLPTENINYSSALKTFEKCFNLRKNCQGKYSQTNVIMCSQFVIRYFKKTEMLKLFLSSHEKYELYLISSAQYFCNCSFVWKIKKALYLIYFHQKPQSSQTKLCLQQTINELQKQISKNQDYLSNQAQELKLQLKRYQFTDSFSQHESYYELNLSQKSNINRQKKYFVCDGQTTQITTNILNHNKIDLKQQIKKLKEQFEPPLATLTSHLRSQRSGRKSIRTPFREKRFS